MRKRENVRDSQRDGEKEGDGENECVYPSPGIFTESFPIYPSLIFSSHLPSSTSHHIVFSQWLLRFLVLIAAISGHSWIIGRSSHCISLDLHSEGKCKKPLGHCISLWLLFPCGEIQMNLIIFLLKSNSPVMLDEVYGSNYFAFWRRIHLKSFSTVTNSQKPKYCILEDFKCTAFVKLICIPMADSCFSFVAALEKVLCFP